MEVENYENGCVELDVVEHGSTFLMGGTLYMKLLAINYVPCVVSKWQETMKGKEGKYDDFCLVVEFNDGYVHVMEKDVIVMPVQYRATLAGVYIDS